MLSLFWGFILTKWYVKTFDSNVLDILAYGFILTKWYVKCAVMLASDAPTCILY
ncbi:TPA: hypothetical protein ACXDVS_004003 [Clostridioides difficile]|nr:hypothetical protein [Clostridioides difficile]MDS2181650.1 hypothetical protein [Clostridioides difficile]